MNDTKRPCRFSKRLPSAALSSKFRLLGGRRITTGEFVFRADGDWEANLTEGDQFYKIADDRLNLVAQSDRLRLYSEYIERPERVAPHAIVDLSAP